MNGLNGLTYMDIKQLGIPGQTSVDNRRAEKSETTGTNGNLNADTKTNAPAARRQPPEVEVSAEAKAVGSALAKVASQPDMDQARIAKVKAAIEEGRYSVSAERIASKMLRFEEEVFQRTPAEKVQERS